MFGGVYDDRLLVKPIPVAVKLMPNASMELPCPAQTEMKMRCGFSLLMKRIVNKTIEGDRDVGAHLANIEFVLDGGTDDKAALLREQTVAVTKYSDALVRG